ncbi:YtxH domain-containing protein [Staphylococcus caprae]|uniref:YtxH domain-containing protein n=1 Tax=Staphylococcus TaxID=1279 RepID=UPI0008A97813|nr:YtxH domain-containing protein [Staphylococcus sp. HMSC62A08]OHS37943.1 lytic transglycosylase [Staphylococcus sp. HMSC62A08]
MFRYYKSAFKNAKPQILKALLFALFSFAACFIVYVFTTIFITKVNRQMQMLQQFGQTTTSLVISLAIIYLILAILFIFVGYQLIAGALNVFQKAMKNEKVKFSDLFFAFTNKGYYSKSLLLALVTVIVFIILSVIAYLLNLLYNFALSQLFAVIQPIIAGIGEGMGILLITQIIIVLIIGFINSIIYWFFFIFIINYTVAFAEDPTRRAFSNVKEGFKGIKNGHKTWFKFFIGVLLLNLIVLLTGQPLITLFSFLTGNMSQSVAQIFVYVVYILIILIRILIYTVIIMGIVYYFITRGEKIDKPDKKARKDKKKNKNTLADTKDDVNHQTSDAKEKAQDKVNNHQSTDDNFKDKAESQINDKKDSISDQGQDLKDNASHKANDVKDNISDKAKDTFDNK